MALTALKKDRLLLGILIGIIVPLIAVYVQYSIKFSGWTISEFLGQLKREVKLLTGVSTIALVVNGLLFGIFIHFKRFETARGIFVPTVIMGIAVLLWKLIR
jgi:hypothetical protein